MASRSRGRQSNQQKEVNDQALCGVPLNRKAEKCHKTQMTPRISPPYRRQLPLQQRQSQPAPARRLDWTLDGYAIHLRRLGCKSDIDAARIACPAWVSPHRRQHRLAGKKGAEAA
jgi:hypothetical protein